MNKAKASSLKKLYDVRRANLCLLIAEKGGVEALGSLLGHKSGSYVSQLASNPPRRFISEVIARGIELDMELPSGWMDMAR